MPKINLGGLVTLPTVPTTISLDKDTKAAILVTAGILVVGALLVAVIATRD